MLTKPCTRCGEDKPVSSFHKCSRNKNGLRGACKACVKLWPRDRLANRLYAQTWRAGNRDRYRAYQRAYNRTYMATKRGITHLDC